MYNNASLTWKNSSCYSNSRNGSVNSTHTNTIIHYNKLIKLHFDGVMNHVHRTEQNMILHVPTCTRRILYMYMYNVYKNNDSLMIHDLHLLHHHSVD